MIAEFDLIVDGISKSKQLLGLADAGEWEQFAELEKQRRLDLGQLHLENLELTSAQYVKLHSKMEKLVELNNQLELICQQQRTELAGQLKKLAHGNKATKAYAQ